MKAPRRFCMTFRNVAWLAVLLCTSANAQGLFGTISGTVTDSSGAVVPNAAIRVFNMNTGVVTRLTTNRDGVYSAGSLNPGGYDIQAALAGLQTTGAKGGTLGGHAHAKAD